jgi:hypothetical protein
MGMEMDQCHIAIPSLIITKFLFTELVCNKEICTKYDLLLRIRCIMKTRV